MGAKYDDSIIIMETKNKVLIVGSGNMLTSFAASVNKDYATLLLDDFDKEIGIEASKPDPFEPEPILITKMDIEPPFIPKMEHKYDITVGPIYIPKRKKFRRK